MSIDIRPAFTAVDLDAIRALLRTYEFEIGFDLGFQGFADELAALPGDYAPPAGRLLCADIAGRVVGCVALRALDEKRCEMKRLYVLPEFRRERAGQAL
ncbi:MAG TPA: GNAT family N-acetyltransferase, partial [Burkholderiaceae bacterium]|nr:GNAT family N-acetyltransferase [Burkholderiaceae bacterium]